MIASAQTLGAENFNTYIEPLAPRTDNKFIIRGAEAREQAAELGDEEKAQ